MARPSNRSRVWFSAFWATSLALLACAGQWAWFELGRRAEDRTALLAPNQTPSPEGRDAALKSIQGYAEVASARWISPQEMVEESTASIRPVGLGEVFPTDGAWLPWTLEVRFRNAARDPDAAAFRVAGLRKDPFWRLVVWDEAAARADADAFRRTFKFLGAVGAVLALFGAFGLAQIPRAPGGWFSEAAGAAAVTFFATAGLGFAPRLLGVEPAPRDWAALLGTGFILAGLAAPVIKGRGVASDVSGRRDRTTEEPAGTNSAEARAEVPPEPATPEASAPADPEPAAGIAAAEPQSPHAHEVKSS